jgi:glycosyltransferase involved in cell wall biosynthesis
MRIALVTPVLVPGDAVSNDVVGMHNALQAAGYHSEIFATHNAIPGLSVKPVEAVESAIPHSEDIFFYHFSVGWDQGLNFLRNLKCRRIIKYHNVTPAEYYDSVNQDYALVCRAGREMLVDVANIPATLFLSDSGYNMQELIFAGASAKRSFVVPPFHQIDRLQEVDADVAILDGLRDGRTNVLMVGRLAPNKGHVALVAAFAAYQAGYNKASRLIIAGKHDARLQLYIDSIHAAIEEADLKRHVIFTHELSDEQLKAYFLAAHVFAITSEHEGFCVPLVEAMAHHIPVVAYASTAITETVGPAGIVWDERDPRLLAASMDEVVRNPVVTEGLAELGWNRYTTHFRNDVIRKRFFEVMKPVLGNSSIG